MKANNGMQSNSVLVLKVACYVPHASHVQFESKVQA